MAPVMTVDIILVFDDSVEEGKGVSTSLSYAGAFLKSSEANQPSLKIVLVDASYALMGLSSLAGILSAVIVFRSL